MFLIVLSLMRLKSLAQSGLSSVDISEGRPIRAESSGNSKGAGSGSPGDSGGTGEGCTSGEGVDGIAGGSVLGPVASVGEGCFETLGARGDFSGTSPNGSLNGSCCSWALTGKISDRRLTRAR